MNLRGWQTNRKIFVIESDDWGSIRMPSREVYEKCLKFGYPVDKVSYERYDTLLSQDDLELLFDLLCSFKDKNGTHPVFTANCVVANPDFEKIYKDSFRSYYFESIIDTFKKYPAHTNNFELWLTGINNGVFYPQYHAREHLNVSLFMNALNNGNEEALWGFENHMPGSIPKSPEVRGNKYVESTMFSSEEDKQEKLAIFLEGLDLFEKLFGYKSESIIPPNYTWSTDFDKAVFDKGIKYFQGNRKTIEPIPGRKPKCHTHYIGESNQLGQIYFVRNVIFEPSMFKFNIKEPVETCLSDISIAFQMKKPAIMSSHRVNFSGFIDETNRDRNLRSLKKLFIEVIKRWPDVEFLTSCNLGAAISGEIKALYNVYDQF